MSDLLKTMTRKIEEILERLDFLEERMNIIENEIDSALDNLEILNEAHGLCEINEEKQQHPKHFQTLVMFCPNCGKQVYGTKGDKHECIKS